MLSWQLLSAVQSSLGPEPPHPSPSIPMSVPVSDSSSRPSGHHLPSKKGAQQPRTSQRPRGSAKGRGPRPPNFPQLVSSSPHLGQGVLWGQGTGEMEAGDNGAVETKNRDSGKRGQQGEGRDPKKMWGWDLAVHGLVSKPLPGSLALTFAFGVSRSPLQRMFRPAPCHLPQVSERSYLFWGERGVLAFAS